MTEPVFQEVLLSAISSNPNNPRKAFKGKNFDELVASIEQKGIIEPIIIRQIFEGGPKAYEIVAGERRYQAASKLHMQTVPAIIRQLSDDEAFDFMIIENLQRENLTQFEEAESFKLYVDKHGEESIPDLAERTGIHPTYIRRRLAVLTLPKNVLKAWKDGELYYSHLEQLMRIRNKETMKDAMEFIEDEPYEEPLNVSKLKDWIDMLAPSLSDAFFNLDDAGCLTCHANSQVQMALWNVGGMEIHHCLNPECFKKKQIDHLTKHWKKTKLFKEFETNGFKLSEDVNYGDYQAFSDYYLPKPVKKCKECQYFLTIIQRDGRPSTERACFGDKSCYNSLKRKQEQRGKKKEYVDENAPRVDWHGEHFREEFFKWRIPEKYKEYGSKDEKVAWLTLYVVARMNHGVKNWLAERVGIESWKFDSRMMFRKLSMLDYDELLELIREATLQLIMNGNVTDHAGRLHTAEHLGIKLEKEWAMTKDYLEVKTIKEMLNFGDKLGIFKAKKAENYLTKKLKKKPGRFDKCKKTELIELFLKSGVNLVGKVPDEIIPKKEEQTD